MVRSISLAALVVALLSAACAQKDQRIGRDNPLDPASNNFHPDSSTVQLTSGLVAYFPFNGNATDESGNGNVSVVNGPVPAADRFGNASSAYLFDGINDYISVTNTPQLAFANNQAFSLSLWLRTSSSHINMFPVMKYGGTANGYDVAINHNAAGFCSGAGIVSFFVATGIPACAATAINDSAWHHIIGVYTGDSNTVTIYVDGVAQAKTGSRTTSDVATPANIMIGGITGFSFAGSIDDIRFYNRVLTSGEIYSLYHEGGWK
jgi:hypothetical protein